MTHILHVEWIFASAERAVIRVYDEMGNVINVHEHAASSKSGEKRLNLIARKHRPINTRNLWATFEEKLRRLVETFA